MLRHGRILRLRARQVRNLRKPSENSNSSPPSAKPRPTGSSSPTASAAASRSPRAPDRHALHLAEVLQMALQPSALDIDDPYPESRADPREQKPKSRASMKRAALGRRSRSRRSRSYSGPSPAEANRQSSPTCGFLSCSTLVYLRHLAQSPPFWDNMSAVSRSFPTTLSEAHTVLIGSEHSMDRELTTMSPATRLARDLPRSLQHSTSAPQPLCADRSWS